MKVLCLDLEGVLVPEVWQAVAARTGLQALEKTTRDIPVYDDLMKYRLQILDEYDIHLSLIQEEIAKLEPLQGAVAFLHWARLRFQVAIVSDTFYEFGMPLMQSLGYPQLLCHTLEVKDDRVVGYTLRQEDPKRQVVKAFKSLKYTVFAAGDSFNDVNMLEEADQGFFYCAPENVVAQFPQFPCTENYTQLQERLSGIG